MLQRFLIPVSFLVLNLIVGGACYAQSQVTGWLASFNTIKTGKKTSIHFDAQLRSTDEIKKIQTILLRPGFNFHINKQWTATAGYAYIGNRRAFPLFEDMIPEHRVWEQLLYSHKLHSVSVSHRLRFEQRFLANVIVYPDHIDIEDYTMAGRLRYFIRNVLPFKKQPVFTKGVFAALQNEVFVNVIDRDKVNDKFFDQNRLYLAMGYRLQAKADLELGYMNQYINGRNSFTNNHVIQLAAYLRL